MVKNPTITSDKEFNYTSDKLNKAVQQCNISTLEWLMASVRSNEKSLCKGEITDDKYMDQQQKVTNLIVDFSYNCKMIKI